MRIAGLDSSEFLDFTLRVASSEESGEDKCSSVVLLVMVLIASPLGPLLPLQGGASVSSQLPRWVSEWAESVRWNAIDLAANRAISIVMLGFLCVG